MVTLWARARACFSNGVGPSMTVPIAMVCVDSTLYDTCRVDPRDRACIPELIEAFGTSASRQKYEHLSSAAYLVVSPTLVRVRCERTGAIFSVAVLEKTLSLISPPRPAPLGDRLTKLHNTSHMMFYM